MAPGFSKLSAVVLALASSMVAPVNGFWRMPCRSRTALARIDPLVDYGVPSKHAHAIHGNGNFNFHSNMTELAANNPCTSCGVLEDTSVYWTPALYFEHDNGDTELVQQVGGMLSYYLLYGQNIKAFPDNFAMIAGNNERRHFPNIAADKPKSDWGPEDTTQAALEAKALGFNCLNYAKTPEPSLFRHQMPSKAYLDANCVDGIRLELMFPSCWNGKDSRARDQKSHMRYPSLVNDGTCPQGFETRLPSLFYETIWDTYAFKGKPGRFVFSNGDYSGNSYHGDFMMGWNRDFLQQAVDTCTNDSGEVSDCPLFTLQSDGDAAKCTLQLPSDIKHDDCVGPRKGLCGGDLKGHHHAPPAQPEPVASSYSVSVASVSTPIPVYNQPKKQQGPPPHKPKHQKPVHATTRKVHDLPSTSCTTTSPPAYVTPAAEGVDILRTRTYTSDGAVYEVVIVEEDVTVYATATTTYYEAAPAAATPYRRHLHHHGHAHHHI
jgi:hypothetical protein